MSPRKIKTRARDGRDAFENVVDHLKTMADHLGQGAAASRITNAVIHRSRAA